MIIHLLGVAAIFAAGFGVGRVKNPAKLAAAQAKLSSIEAKLLAEEQKVKDNILASTLVAELKKLL